MTLHIDNAPRIYFTGRADLAHQIIAISSAPDRANYFSERQRVDALVRSFHFDPTKANAPPESHF